MSEAQAQERLRKVFSSFGIAHERILCTGMVRSTVDHLGIYGQVDIALDTFPYNGTTTTCEALWMGVPVVTLSGDRHAARVGKSLLQTLGLPEMVAESPDEYVDRAIMLASNLDRLVTLRTSLRELMRASSLCDAQGFARRIEAAYRQMWRDWCDTTTIAHA
jgi:predicted O-linked N-acetylglucosamine transferase (SPINDLY family)